MSVSEVGELWPLGRDIRPMIGIAGIWLRRIGDDTEVWVDTPGGWHLAIRVRAEDNYSEFVTAQGIASTSSGERPAGEAGR